MWQCNQKHPVANFETNVSGTICWPVLKRYYNFSYRLHGLGLTNKCLYFYASLLKIHLYVSTLRLVVLFYLVLNFRGMTSGNH